jgi:hypothetical protein
VRITLTRVGAVLVLGILSACGGAESQSGMHGECTGSIRFHDAVYVPDSRLNQSAPKGHILGQGDVVDCDFATVVDQAVVSEVKGVDSSVAIRVTGRWHRLYVAKTLPRAEWPKALRLH